MEKMKQTGTAGSGNNKIEVLKEYHDNELDIVRETLPSGERKYYHPNFLLENLREITRHEPIPVQTGREIQNVIDEILLGFKICIQRMDEEEYSNAGFLLDLILQQANQSFDELFAALKASGIEIEVDYIMHSAEHYRPNLIVGAFLSKTDKQQSACNCDCKKSAA